jgi:hypothetical protein
MAVRSGSCNLSEEEGGFVGLRLETHEHDDKVARWDGDGQDREGRETPKNWHGRFDFTWEKCRKKGVSSSRMQVTDYSRFGI